MPQSCFQGKGLEALPEQALSYQLKMLLTTGNWIPNSDLNDEGIKNFLHNKQSGGGGCKLSEQLPKSGHSWLALQLSWLFLHGKQMASTNIPNKKNRDKNKILCPLEPAFPGKEVP